MTFNSGVTGKTVNQLIRSKGAIARQKERDARSVEQQLALLDQRPGESKRERARLAESSGRSTASFGHATERGQ
jgi:hypothetical protein